MLRWPLALAALVACAPSEDLALPTLADGAPASAAVLLELGEGGSELGARGLITHGLGSQPLGATVPGELVLLYGAKISQLGWRTGPIQHDPVGRSRLRAPDRVLRRAGDGPWVEVASSDPVHAVLRKIRVDWREDPCGTGALCFDEAGYCALCDEAEVDPPAPPEPWSEPACERGMHLERTTVAGLEVAGCAAAELAACGPTERATLDGSCVPVGRACMTDAEGYPTPESSPSAANVFVAPDGTPSGDGSRARPWDLRTALARASEGSTLVLARGTHAAGDLGAGPALRLRGACVAETTVSLGGAVGRPISLSDLALLGEGVMLEAPLEAEGIALRGAITATRAGSLTIAGSLVEGGAVRARGVDASFDASELRSVALDLRDGGRARLRGVAAFGYVAVASGTSLEVEDSVLEAGPVVGPLAVALHAHSSTVTLRRSQLRRKLADRGSPVSTTGLALADGAVVRLDTVRLDGFRTGSADPSIGEGDALNISGRGASLSFERVVIDGCGVGVGMVLDTTLRGRGLAISRATSFGVHLYREDGDDAASPDPVAELEDVLIESPGPLGIFAQGGQLTLSRARLKGGGLQLAAGAAGATLDADDLSILDAPGIGLDARGREGGRATARLELARVAIERTGGVALWQRSSGVEARYHHVTIRDVRALSAGAQNDCDLGPTCSGTGVLLNAVEPGSFELDHFLVEDARDAALAWDGTIAPRFEDGTLRRSRQGALGPHLEDVEKSWRDRLVRVRMEEIQAPAVVVDRL